MRLRPVILPVINIIKNRFSYDDYAQQAFIFLKSDDVAGRMQELSGENRFLLIADKRNRQGGIWRHPQGEQPFHVGYRPPTCTLYQDGSTRQRFLVRFVYDLSTYQYRICTVI